MRPRPPAEEPVELFGTETSAATTTSSVTKATSIQAWLGVALAVVLAAGTVWWLSTGRANREAASGDDEQAEPVLPAKNEAAASTTTARPGRTTPSSTVTVVETGPIAPDSGLSLLLGGPQKWRVLNLETGTSYDVDQRGDLVGFTGDYVLAVLGDELQAVHLDGLAGEPKVLASASYPAVIPGANNGQIWLPTADSQLSSGTFELFDLASEQVIETRNIPSGGLRLSGFGLQLNASIDIVSPAAGGVYAYDGTGYRRAIAGSLVASGENLALVDRCDDNLVCVFEWRDTTSWDLIDRPVPERNFDYAGLVGGDRLLLLISWRGLSYQLFDTRSGELHNFDEFGLDNGSGPTFSPDGRWMASLSDASLYITDLDTMETIEVEGRWSNFWSTAFLDRPMIPPG